MKFTFRKSDFTQAIFPSIDLSDNEAVRGHLSDFYSRDGQKPFIEIDGDLIQVSLATNPRKNFPDIFYKATDLCTLGRFSEAIPLLEKLIQTNPSTSEYHRNLGQAHEEMGNYQLAIDSLIESLRWNPKNKWALLLMGNIYVKYQNDFKTALTYFDEVMELDQDNFLGLSNIGGTFLQAGKPNLAERFFKRALKSNPIFPNALHGLGIVQFEKGNLAEAFDFGVSALKLTDPSDKKIVAIIEGFVINVASRFTKKEGRMDISADFILELEALSGKEIQLSTDSNLPVDARIKIAENYDRDFHRVSY